MKKVWIAWEIHRRNRTTSKALGAELFEFHYQGNRWLRYLIAITKTLAVLLRERPAVIFAQNPSLVLAVFAVFYGRILNIPTVIDAHNAGLMPFSNRRRWANILASTVMRLATLTIVTNDGLARYVVAHKGRPFILPDPLPDLPIPTTKFPLNGKLNVLFICTWAEDEPYLEVLKAAKTLDQSIYIYITGRSKGREKELGMTVPQNAILTGYLDEAVYGQILFSADVIMDLTTREDCLVCGAYEAVAAEKPLILSDTAALREYFYKGVVYTNNSANDIRARIVEASSNHDRLVTAIQELKNELYISWEQRRQNLEEMLGRVVQAK